MVRALVAGVGDFPESVMREEDQADGVLGFTPLPNVAEAVRELASAMARAGAVTGGAPLLEGDESAFMSRWRELRQHADPGEPLVVHFAGHGIQAGNGSLYLAASGGQAREDLLSDTCVSFGRLLESAENSGRPVLFLLDVCEAGQALVQQQLTDLAAHRRQDAPRSVWIIGACTSNDITYGARFTTATAQVLNQLADGDLDITPTLAHVPLETLATAVDRHVARTDRAARRPRQHLVCTPRIQADGEPQPFFRNPAHTRNPRISPLAGVDPRLREFALGCSPDLDPLHFVTRAAGTSTVQDILFSGRRSQLEYIQTWLAHTTNPQSLLVITGGEGSGKSALLGVLVCLLHPELEELGERIARSVSHFDPRQPEFVLAVHARQLTFQQITESLYHQLQQQGRGPNVMGPKTPPPDTREVLHELRSAGDVLVVLDALDEAIDPAAVLNGLVLPLAAEAGRPSSCRVVLGTRKWWDTLPALRQYLTEHPRAEIDLDPQSGRDRSILADDLTTYLRGLLPRKRYPRDEVRRVAERLAQYSDHGAFLVAHLYANHLLTTPDRAPAGPPCTITEVFDLDVSNLAANDPWICTVLNVLGQARGQGMPLALIHTAALAHQPTGTHANTYALADTRRALAKAAFYLRTAPDTDHSLLYRYFHQALTNHTKAHIDPVTFHQALTTDVPTTESGTPDWANAHPYLLRHAADHAAAAGNDALDRLLTDPNYLFHADPDTLTPHLHHAQTEQGLLHADIYRATVSDDSRRHQIETHQPLLTVDSASGVQQALTHPSLAETPEPPPE